MNDLVVIVLTARCEPFEGINETINFQMGNVIGKIDDFRAMSIWNEAQRIQKRYWPKDVGHEAALQQPYEDMMQRNWTEVVNSTLLMLKITDMVRSGDEYATFSFVESLEMVRKIK